YGSATTPTAAPSSSAIARLNELKGSPCTKLVVPSIGSTYQQGSPESPPYSSPRTRCEGKRADSRARASRSISRSTAVTQSATPSLRRASAGPDAIRSTAQPASESAASRQSSSWSLVNTVDTSAYSGRIDQLTSAAVPSSRRGPARREGQADRRRRAQATPGGCR